MGDSLDKFDKLDEYSFGKKRIRRRESFFSIKKCFEKIKTPVIRQIILWKDIGKNVIL